GILTGKRATCFPGFESKMDGAIFTEENVVVDGTIITSRGVGTTLPFALAIIENLIDEPTSRNVGKAVLYYGQ
ncbi:MAG: DJ-1 family protein, partial [Chitinivibrionales bacterium]|nr:DJ-1 family protein [Chitinivibrionales bacterium]